MARSTKCVSLARIVVAGAGLALAPAAMAQTIYFVDIDAGAVRSMTEDGQNLMTVIGDQAGILSADVDTAAGKIYFSIGGTSTIRSCNLDGSNAQDAASGGFVDYPAVVRVNPPQQTVMWGDQSSSLIGVYFQVNGTNGPVTTTPFHRGLFIDQANQVMYWSVDVTSTTGNIVRADINGANQTTIITGQGKPAALVVDTAGGKIYWTDYVNDVVRRANLNGSGVETLYTDQFGHSPRGIALDLAAGKVYWGQDVGDEPTTGEVLRTNLDGSDIEFIQTGLGLVQDLVIVPAAATVCYANCDGSTAAPILNVADFTCFLQKFAGADSYANCDGSTAAPVLNVADFTCFLQKFAAGCP